MNSQISSEFYQIPFFQEDIVGDVEPISCVNECYGKLLVIFFENVNIFDIFHCRLDTASKQTHKGADAPKVIHEC